MSNTITLDEAKTALNSCRREELRDHAFGDREIYWMSGETEVGFSYLGGGGPTIVSVELADGREANFTGREANELLRCGTLHVTRNDETGPDQYADGDCMPGLTLEGVKKELCG